jgi:hypothetical protein
VTGRAGCYQNSIREEARDDHSLLASMRTLPGATPPGVRSRMRSRSILDAIVATIKNMFSATQILVRICRLTSRTCLSSNAPHRREPAGSRTRPTIWADPRECSACCKSSVTPTTLRPTGPLSVSEVVCTRDLEKYRHVQGSAAIRAVCSRMHELTGSSVLLCTTVKAGCR